MSLLIRSTAPAPRAITPRSGVPRRNSTTTTVRTRSPLVTAPRSSSGEVKAAGRQVAGSRSSRSRQVQATAAQTIARPIRAGTPPSSRYRVKLSPMRSPIRMFWGLPINVAAEPVLAASIRVNR